MIPSLKWISIGIAAIMAFLFLSAVLEHFNTVGWYLIFPIRRARRSIRNLLKSSYPNVRVSSLGASAIDPSYFCILIDVTTDLEKRELRTNAKLDSQIRALLASARYPSEAISQISISIESQETVTRDFGGNWFYARK